MQVQLTIKTVYDNLDLMKSFFIHISPQMLGAQLYGFGR